MEYDDLNEDEQRIYDQFMEAGQEICGKGWRSQPESGNHVYGLVFARFLYKVMNAEEEEEW